jgi:hypothetical protein
MSGQRRQSLRDHLLLAGLNLSSTGPEEDHTIFAWLEADLLDQPPPTWPTLLPRALEVARDVFRSFAAAYAEAFLDTDGVGVLVLRRFLRLRFGFVDAHTEEVILERIRDRRLLLLEHLRRKFQPSFFAAKVFDPALLPGYFRRVAWLESLKVPVEDLPWNRVRLDPAVLRASPRLASVSEPDTETGVDYGDLSTRVSAFWSKGNGFTPEQHREGVVSLGLGRLTDDATLQEGCDQLLAAKLPAWETRLATLRRHSSKALARLEELRGLLTSATGEPRKELETKLAMTEDRLRRYHLLLALHPQRLRPRPAEVQLLLTGCGILKAGAVRHQRIGREIAVFRRRVSVGWEALQRTAEVPPVAILDLGRAVATHLAAEPPSPRQHGLAEVERQQRRVRTRAWRAAAVDLLTRVRGCLTDYRGSHAQERPLLAAIEAWLCDTEDLYELGVLARKGLLHGLGRRHGWRLHHLLRVTDAVAARSPQRLPRTRVW